MAGGSAGVDSILISEGILVAVQVGGIWTSLLSVSCARFTWSRGNTTRSRPSTLEAGLLQVANRKIGGGGDDKVRRHGRKVRVMNI